MNGGVESIRHEFCSLEFIINSWDEIESYRPLIKSIRKETEANAKAVKVPKR
jgi:hypothetical protein